MVASLQGQSRQTPQNHKDNVLKYQAPKVPPASLELQDGKFRSGQSALCWAFLRETRVSLCLPPSTSVSVKRIEDTLFPGIIRIAQDHCSSFNPKAGLWKLHTS